MDLPAPLEICLGKGPADRDQRRLPTKNCHSTSKRCILKAEVERTAKLSIVGQKLMEEKPG